MGSGYPERLYVCISSQNHSLHNNNIWAKYRTTIQHIPTYSCDVSTNLIGSQLKFPHNFSHTPKQFILKHQSKYSKQTNNSDIAK